MTRTLLCLAAAALGLAGCTTDGQPGLSASAPGAVDALPVGSIIRDHRDEVLPPNLAVLTLPGFEATRVRERAFADGALQQIDLAGPAPHGGNLVEIAVKTVPGRAADMPLPLAKPTEAGIRAEILARFPDVRMQIVPKPMANAFGPFGLAIGHYSDGARCLFAWQWIDGFGETTLPASVRLRVCRAGVPVDDLARAMQGLTLADRQATDRLRGARFLVAPAASGTGATGVGTGTLEQALGAPPLGQAGAPAPRHREAGDHGGSVVRRSTPTPTPAAPLEPFSGPYLAPVKPMQTGSAASARMSVALHSNSPRRNARRTGAVAATAAADALAAQQ